MQRPLPLLALDPSDERTKFQRLGPKTGALDDVLDYWQFKWPDGCFFTFEAKTNEPDAKSAKDHGLGIRYLSITIKSESAYDAAFADQYDADVEEFGHWSIAIPTLPGRKGVTQAVFLDEWWTALPSKACASKKKIAARYIVATAILIEHYLPGVSAAPADQKAVCDPLIINPDDSYPVMTPPIPKPRAAFQLLYDAHAAGLPDQPTDLKTPREERFWDSAHADEFRAVRRRALTELILAGSWRVRLFASLGGVFPDVDEFARKTRFAGTYDELLYRYCETEADYILKKYEQEAGAVGWRLTDANAFVGWFKSVYCPEAAYQNKKGHYVYSNHPLHTLKFSIDPLRAARIIVANVFGNDGDYLPVDVHKVTPPVSTAPAGS